MKRKSTALVAGIVAVAVVLGGLAPVVQTAGTVSAASTAAIVVDDDSDGIQCTDQTHETLQGGIAAASPGDTIKVCSGVYGGADISTDSLTIVGTSPRDVSIAGAGEAFGVNISASGIEVRNVTVTGFSSAGILIKQGGAGTKVTQSKITANTGDGVQIASSANTDDMRIVRNSITANDGLGINNENTSTSVSAWLNDWGSDSGPGSETGETSLKDPKTDAPANGTGDEVSLGAAGQSNVQFDPWVGKPACSDSQMDNLVEQDTINNLTRACAWDRALLPLRTDNTDAGTRVPNMNVYVNGSGVSEKVPANRQELAVYNKSSTVSIGFTDVPGYANTDQFKDTDSDGYTEDDVQLLILGGPATPDAENLSFNQSSGELEIPHGATTADVRDNAEGVGELRTDGNISIDHGLGTADEYTFVLVRKKFGDGLGTAGENITVDGGIDVLGVEHIRTQEAVAKASVTNGPVTVGKDATFQVGTNLPSTTGSQATHSVIIYDRDRFTSASTTLEIDASLSDVLTGGLSSDQVTAYHSIEYVSGIYRVDTAFTIFGVEVPALTEQGKVPVSSILQVNGQATSNTVLDSSATSKITSSDTATVDVGTFGNNFSTGTYQYVYVADQGSQRSTTAGTFQVVSQSTGGGGTAPPPAGGGGGGGGGGDAPPRDGDQDGDSVRVVDASLSDSSIEPGRLVEVTGVVRNDRQSPARFTANLYVDDEEINSRTITVPAQSNKTVTFSQRFEETGEYDIRVNEVTAGTLTVEEAGTETPSNGTETAEPGDGTPTDTTGPGQGSPGGPGDGAPGLPLIIIGVLIVLAALGGAAYYVFQSQA